jgi:outer membrane receptor protein involved in Fe transport
MIYELKTLGGVSMLALTLANVSVSPASAQEGSASPTSTAAAQNAPETSANEAEDDESGAIVVTGTRIRHKGAASATPTTVITSETISKSGTRQIADLVNQMPALVISQSDQTSNANRDKDSLDSGHPGLNLLDLRGLGSKRTLVLVNGRRHVPGAPGTSGVDISTIPSGLVERVEIITGGASAQYGADAVAGVANFIMKKNYQGLDAKLSYTNSTYGDMPGYDGEILWGKNFADGKANVTLFAYYGQSNGIVGGQDRPSTAYGNPWWYRPAGTTMNTILDDRHSFSYSPRAVVLLGSKPYVFNDDGTMRAPRLGSAGILPNTLDLTKNSVVGQLETNSGSEFGGRYDNWLLSVPNDRLITHGTFAYQLSDHVRYFLEADYATNKSHGEYGLWYEGGGNKLWDGNPFITPEIIAANGGQPFGADGLTFVRQFPEFGKSRSDYRREMYQVVTGLEGELPGFFRGHDWSWATHFSYGKTRETIRDRNNTSNDRYLRALDAVSGPGGTPICWVNSDADTSNDDPNCVALNPFKPIPQNVIDYLQYDSSESSTSLEQYVVSGYATGGLFNLPGGEVQVVLGGEFRSESNNIGARAEYDPNNPAFVADYGVIENPLKGRIDVSEIFGELSVPLLKDLPLIHRLSLESAIRVADYSTAGTTTAEKYGVQWAPVKDLRFRATYGKAVRAPNISEVFTASSVSGQWLSDPCNYYNLPNRPDRSEFTAANCAAAMPTNKNDFWLWLDVIKQGNPDLKVETAKTLTLGMVFQPSFVKNFTATVDYYKINMRDVISSVEPQTIINKCMDGATLDNAYCALVVRDPVTNNLVSVLKQNINLSRRRTSGVDFEVDYWFDLADLDLGGGRIGINSVFTRLIENEYTPDPDKPDTITDTFGVFGFPELKGRASINYSKGKLWVGWTARYFSGMRQTTTITPETYTPYRTPSVTYHDLNASYQLRPNLTLGAGFSNLFNKQPPRYPGAEAGGAYFGDEGWQAGVYDVMGRTGFLYLRFTH